MNSDEFYKEVVESNLEIANFDSIYSEFKGYQNLIRGCLREFHRICEKYNIRYQLAYGSLLGAIRDNGQIPWDYDIDVFIPFNEKFKLIAALKEDLDEQFYFYCPENNENCRHVIMRIAPKGYKSEVLHLDVFYLIGTSDDENIRKQHVKNIKKWSNYRYYKLINIMNEKVSFSSSLKLLVHKIRSMPLPIKDIGNRYNELSNLYDVEKSNVLTTADSFADWYVFPKDMLETILFETLDGTFRVPKNYDKILSILYGDYRKTNSLESRVQELLHYHKRLKAFEN